MNPYRSAVNQADFDAALAQSRSAGMLYLVGEVFAIRRYIHAVLAEEGHQFFSFRKRRRRKEFLDACDEEVRRRIDLREFFFTTSFGAVIVVDPVRAAEERKLEKLKRAKENAEHARWSDSHVRDNRTSVTITKDEATTKILFGRARLSDFSSL